MHKFVHRSIASVNTPVLQKEKRDGLNCHLGKSDTHCCSEQPSHCANRSKLKCFQTSVHLQNFGSPTCLP